MSTPDEQVQAVLGDVAAAQAPPSDVPNIPVENAVPSEADVDALRAQLEAAEAARAAAVVPEPDPEPAVVEPVAPSASSEVQAALRNIHDRLVALEQHIGL